MFSLESPHRGDSNGYTKHTIFSIKKKITLNYPKYNDVCSFGIFFLGTQERVRNRRGKRAISVRVIEVLLYIDWIYIQHFRPLPYDGFNVLCSSFSVISERWEGDNERLCAIEPRFMVGKASGSTGFPIRGR